VIHCFHGSALLFRFRFRLFACLFVSLFHVRADVLKNKQASKHTKKQTNKQANKHTNKQTTNQPAKQRNKQIGHVGAKGSPLRRPPAGVLPRRVLDEVPVLYFVTSVCT
jgi:hypothetical protein